MSSLPRPIFVVGCPRSGTTLVQCILSASPQAFSLPETHFFSYVLPELGGDPLAPIGPAQVRAARALLEAEARLALDAAFWAALERQAASEPIRAPDIFVGLIDQFRPGPDLRAIEKTPRHVLHLDLIGRLFPDAVFVNVVRDPMDVVSSMLGVPWGWENSRSVLSQAQRWLESIRAAQAYAARHPGRIWSVVYEDLVRAPERSTRDLCGFVGLDYAPAMLQEFGRQASRNIARGETWKDDIGRGVLLDRQGVWRSRLTPGQAWLAAQATRGAAEPFGYRSPSASAASILAAAAGEARVRFREARSMTGLVGAARHAGSVLKTLAVV